MTERTLSAPTIFPLLEDDEERRREAVLPDQWRSHFAGKARKRSEVAEALAKAGLDAAALSVLQTEISGDTDPETRSCCYLIAGRIRERFGEFEAAARCYEEATARDLPDSGDRYFAYNNLGYCLNRLGRHREAEACCRRAIQVDPARFNAHKNLGISLECTGRLGEAADAYLVAARAELNDGRALRRLRILLANHPELGRHRPDLVDEVQALQKSSRVPRSGVQPLESGMGDRVRALVQDIRVGEEVATDGIQVFGLFWEPASHFDYATLDEALAAGTLEVTEVNERGQVTTLKVSNASETPVLLMAGEQVVGAKQNRVLNSSIMVGGRIEMDLPVTCVEQGRWAYRSRRFATSGTSSHAALRLMMTKQVLDAYQRGGQPRSDQGGVWREVTRKLWATGTSSDSQALHEVYETHRARLDEIHRRIVPREPWCGAVFAFGGRIIGLDLFDRPATLRKLWPKLVRAYAIDAFEKKDSPAVSRGHVEEWVRGLARTAVEEFRSPGLGIDVRLEGDRLVGAMLVVDETPVHLEAFADDDE